MSIISEDNLIDNFHVTFFFEKQKITLAGNDEFRAVKNRHICRLITHTIFIPES